MTSEQSPPARPARPGVAARRQALGAATGAPTPPPRESLRESLARIPDLDPAVPAAAVAGAGLISEPVEMVQIAAPVASPAATTPAAPAPTPGDPIPPGGVGRSLPPAGDGAPNPAADAPIAPSSALARAILDAPPVGDVPADLDADAPAPWAAAAAPEPAYGRRQVPMWRRVNGCTCAS